MEIEDRKYYGETILKLIDNSIIKKNVFTTAMSSNGKELKARLQNMLFSKKMSKTKATVSLVLMLSMVVSGLAIGCTVMPAEMENINYPFVVYIKEDGLYFTYLNEEKENKIQDGNGFEYPLISKDGNYVAYTYNNSLYIYDVKAEKYEKIADEIEHYYTTYDWIDDTTIVYGSTKKPGFAVFNVSTGEKAEHLDEYYYTNFKVSDTKTAYARKESRWTTDEGEFVSNDGIVEINLNDYDSKNNAFATNIIIKGRMSTDIGKTIGYNPVVWNITEDGKYVYIMEKPASGSLSADGIGIGIYDVDKREHTELADITTLSYKNHLAINPKDNNLIGLIKGAGREMIENKEVVLLNIEEDKTYKTVNFMEEGLVAMTPSFTPDGEKLLYSATKNLEGISAINLNGIYGDIYTDVYDVWEDQPHNIYEYDLKTSTTRKITEGDNFDFMPVSISENIVLFSRYKSNEYYSLIILVDGKESIIADNIIFRGGSDNYQFEFYGYTQTERGLDIFIPAIFNNIAGWDND